MHLLKLLLGEHEPVHLLLSRGTWDGNTANKRGSSLLFFLGLSNKMYHYTDLNSLKEHVNQIYLNIGGDGEGCKI